MTKEYSNKEITIKWQTKKCKHAAIYVKKLPKIYTAKTSPWITIENATTKDQRNQINNCSSGALSYYTNE